MLCLRWGERFLRVWDAGYLEEPSLGFSREKKEHEEGLAAGFREEPSSFVGYYTPTYSESPAHRS